ncbi:E3 ubiquitin/ISG15 ligase TRIM25-like [Discoglossus pictus]
MASADLREELNCSICLSIYTTPVTLRCGHNFCQGCIGSVLDTQEGSGVYTCPECRAEYQERPAPQRNLKLCNIAEHFLRAEQEDLMIFCIYCESPVPAVKTCLQCETSLCDYHLKKHNKLAEHTLIGPVPSLVNRKCSIHKKLLNYYCSEDSVCVCEQCFLVGEHQGHQVDLLHEASEKKKVKSRQCLESLTSEREEAEKNVQTLQEHKKEMQEKAAGVSERVTALFMDIREELEAIEKRVLNEITRQQKVILHPISDLIEELEIRKDKLSMKISYIEKMSSMTDPFMILQESETIDDIDKARDQTDINVLLENDLDEVLISLTLQRSFHTLADVFPDLKAKRGFLVQEASGILPEANIISDNTVVSQDMNTDSDTKGQEASDRFMVCQSLSTRRFESGQNYWEVETSDSGNWRVGVCYPSMGKEIYDRIGSNEKSWCLWKWNKYSSLIHNLEKTKVYLEPSVLRYGIYLDYEAGRLSFYQLCDPIRHLHTFTATFTEPLHAAFFVYMNGWVRIRN